MTGYIFVKTYRFNPRDSICKSSDFAGLAPVDNAAYAFPDLKQPFINVDDSAVIQRGIDRAAGISRRMASDEIRVPRGVYRFKTHTKKLTNGGTKRLNEANPKKVKRFTERGDELPRV